MQLDEFNESVGWRKLFKIHSKYITSESRLKKKLSIVLPYRNETIFCIGNDGYWLLEIYSLEKLILIDPEGTYTEFDKLRMYMSAIPHNHKFIVFDEFESILILDGDSEELSGTGRTNKDTRLFWLSNYGEFVYIENNRLNIPDRNISVSLYNRDYEKYSIYFGKEYYTMMVNDIFVSYPFDDERKPIKNSIVYKDKLLYIDSSHGFGTYNKYYNYKTDTKFGHRIIEVYNNTDNTLEEIIDTANLNGEKHVAYLDSNGTSILTMNHKSGNIVIEIFGPSKIN